MVKKTICLTMIVKNEAHIIADTLAHLHKYIQFDYWVISDTGSTDNTREIIKDFFAAHKIPGELVDTPWQDFGFNRSEAFRHAYKKTDYAFVWDADDEIHGNFVMPAVLTDDSYMFTFGNEDGFRYSRGQLFNNQLKWIYKGVLHEYAECTEHVKSTGEVRGDYYFISGRRGDRSKDPNKYLKDALILEKASAEALITNDPLYNRYIFYCAQSYASCNMYEKAIEFYKKTAASKNQWQQERYISCLEIYEAYEKLKTPEEGLRYLVDSYTYDSKRVECFYRLIKHYCIAGQNEIAYMYYTLIQNYFENEYPSDNISNRLFARKSEYDFYLPYYMVIVAERAKRLETAAKMYEMIVKQGYTFINDWWAKNLIFNMQFCIEFLPKDLKFFKDFMKYTDKLRERGIVFEHAQLSVIGKVIDYYKPLLVEYNKPVADALTTKVKAKKPKILFTITSCKRFDLFEKTINSIMNTWTDLDKVDYFFCVDDNSRQIDRSKMTKAYPFFNYHMKTKSEKGHRASMNIIYEKLKELEPTYWIHLEDDWLFFQESAYVQKSMDFLESYKSAGIHQILYNRNYAEIYDGWTINGSEQLNKDFLVHVKSDTIPGQNCGYWPHYSFRPSMIRASVILELGNYDSPNTFFERDYADKYFAKAYRSGFFNTVSCLHTGKLTSDKTGTNAYTLNKMGQFSATASGKQSTFVVNLLRRTDRKEEVEKAFEAAGIDDYEFYEAVDGSKLELTEEISSLFLGNDFGSRRGVIGCALSHLDLWKQLKADPTTPFYTVFEDDITLCEDFKAKLENSKKDLEGVDIIFLGYHVRTKNKEAVLKGSGERVALDNNMYVGGTVGYIVTQSGCKKLLDYIGINGIKHGIDYLMKIVPGIKSFNPQPHIIFSDWLVSSESAVDTDIQRDYSSLKIVPKVSKDDWIFYEGVDSADYDVQHVGGKTLDELMAIGMELPTCAAFNTLGYFKSKVNSTLKVTPYIYHPGSGIYVKKTYQYKDCMNTRILEKESYETKDLVGLAGRCDWFVYHDGFINITNTSLPSTVFLHAYKGDKSLEKFMSEYLPLIKAPFNLIVASDDSTFPLGNADARYKYYADKQDIISALLENPNLHKIYVENLDTTHPKMSAIPLGLLKNGLEGYHSSLEIMDFPIDFSSKPLDCFCIHRTREGEQWDLRKKVSELCKREWSAIVNYHEGDTMGPADIYRHMRKSKFCLCVRGGGYDPSPKCWEAIMNGCIPIIEHSPLDEVYKKFPVVFVDSWSAESITKEKMQKWLVELRPFYEDPEKRKGVLEMLTMDYWWNIVRLPKDIVSGRPWISSVLSGGLGNRLFQMSAALGLSEKLNRPLVIYKPKVYRSTHQNLNNIYSVFPGIPLVDTPIENIQCITEGANEINTYKQLAVPDNNSPILLSGYRHSDKYFPTGGINLKLEALVDTVRWEKLLGEYGLVSESDKLRSWFIHIRLGDYVSNNCVNHVTVDTYHKKALAAAEIPSGANIIVFSDEPDKVRDILQPYLTNPFTVCKETEEIVSLALMSQCWAGAIVPNSTFSWWGAYLAHQKTSSPRAYKAYYPNIWNTLTGTVCRDTIPSWGTTIDLMDDDDWVFHPGLDTKNSDIYRSDIRDITELKFAALRDPNCAGFNTLGFFKRSVKYPLTKSPWIHAPGGLYVKKSYVPSCRVKMLCNWCSSKDLCNEMLKMSKGNYRWNDIEITWEDTDIDYYVIINKPPPDAKFIPEKTIVFHMEPWCGDSAQNWGVKTWGEWAKPDPAKFLQVRSHDNFINVVYWQVNMSYTQLKESQIDKKNPLLDNTVASICSSKYFDPGHKKRIDFMKYIEGKDDPAVSLHLFNEDNQHNFKSYQGKAKPYIDKEKGILPYKYYFMCENNAEKNFITEKLWEPILCEALCFYWGCPNVTDYIDPRAFVQLNIDDFEGSFQVVKQAIQDNLWGQRLPYILKEKQKILEFYGFFPTLERILKPKAICFIHSCNLGTPECGEILERVLNAAKGVKELDAIIINNIGKPLDMSFYTSQDNRIRVINSSDDITLFELPTLKLMHDYCKENQSTKVLYLHTKGITYSNKLDGYIHLIHWIDMMLYFLCEKSEDCLRILDTYDTTGCNFSEKPSPHYSGNFWWATSKHLSKLSKDDLTDKMSGEWWVLSNNPNKYIAHNSEINHFQQIYPREIYTQFVPTFHILIATGGRPSLLNMLNSLKEQLTASDAITIVFDGADARGKSGYNDDWVRDHKCVVKTIDQIPNLGAEIGGEPIRNNYQGLLNPVTTYIMHADDDDVYMEGSFNVLREKCRDPHLLYIARIQGLKNVIIPREDDTRMWGGNIGSPNGIIPFNDAPKASWGIMRGGDCIYYNNLQNKVKGVEYLPDIIYKVLQIGYGTC